MDTHSVVKSAIDALRNAAFQFEERAKGFHAAADALAVDHGLAEPPAQQGYIAQQQGQSQAYQNIQQPIQAVNQ